MIIGLTGSYAAGKDTVADYLVKQGFVYHSLSDILREQLKQRGKEITRDNLIAIGNEIRKLSGPSELARRTLEIIEKNLKKNSLVVSIRNPEEVKILKRRTDFQLWFIDAPQKLRYERTIKRQRSDDDFKSFKDFVAKEGTENSADPNAQQLDKVAEMTDVTIQNDSDLASLHKKIDQILGYEKR